MEDVGEAVVGDDVVGDAVVGDAVVGFNVPVLILLIIKFLIFTCSPLSRFAGSC